MIDQDGGNAPATQAPQQAPPQAQQKIPEPGVDRPSRWLPSLVWLIPLLAAIIGATQVATWLLDKGPTITVSFSTGEGLEAGKTRVKYRDVDIGQVTKVTLGPDAARVLATIQMAKEAERFAAADTRFWVVRPQIGTSGVTGLGTLLSGAYIGAAPGTSAETSSAFTGLEKPPAVPPGLKGREFRLHGDSLGSLSAGAPVYYRRVRVGQVASAQLDNTGKGVDLSVFIEQPYIGLVGADTRWWHASGVDVRVDANGLKLNTQSLATLVTGGIAFESPSGQKPAAMASPDTTFVLAADRAAALRPPDGPAVTTVMFFDQSLRGLSAGAPVDFRGIVLGEVRNVGIEYDRAHKKFRMPVTVDLYPGRLGQSVLDALNADASGPQDALAQMVKRGFRGQLRTGSLLTNQLYVNLDFFPKAPKAALVALPARADVLVLPTVPGPLDELQSQLSRIAGKLDKIPFDQIGNNLNKTLVQANAMIARLDGKVLPEMQEALNAAKKTFASADALLQQDSPLQSELRQTLQDVQQTVESLNTLSDYLERHPESLIRGKAKEKAK
jgi:paraquat-inducible protein B